MFFSVKNPGMMYYTVFETIRQRIYQHTVVPCMQGEGFNISCY